MGETKNSIECLRKVGVFDLPGEATERYAAARAESRERDRESRDLYHKFRDLAAEARESGWTPDMPFPDALLVRHDLS